MHYPTKKIAVLIESHFDDTEFRRFNEVFPQHGYTVEYLSNLWNQPELTFHGNDDPNLTATVSLDLRQVNPADYDGVLLIGGYAMDRLRYDEQPRPGQPNQSPAVAFLRRCVATEGLKIGTICHSLWLFCAAPELLRGRRVTCSHNILCDVQNAGGVVTYGEQGTAEVCVDGDLITAKHPGVVDRFLDVFLAELARATEPQYAEPALA